MTKKFAIIGKPISHSLSPTLHNYWFKKYDLDSYYSLMDVHESDLGNVVEKIRTGKLSGINVTLPFKQKIIPFLDALINDAKFTNSVNTVYLDKNNRLVGENTDVFGVQAAFLKEIVNVENKNALIIGAGGVAPSIIKSFQTSKIKKISIVNRTYEKSVFLGKKFNLSNIIKWNNLKNELSKFDIIINATSLGLKNNDNFDFNFDNIKTGLIYIDTIYNPLETRNIKLLKEKGIKTFNGLNMFIYQGQKSFYLWNKINPEIDDRLLDLLGSKLK